MLTVLVVMYFSLVPAIVASNFCQEIDGGQIHSLLSLPGSIIFLNALNKHNFHAVVSIRHYAAATIVVGCVLSLVPFVGALVVFHFLLQYSAAFLPAAILLLLGWALGTYDVYYYSYCLTCEQFRLQSS